MDDEVEMEDELDALDNETEKEEARQILRAALEILSKDSRLTIRNGKLSQTARRAENIRNQRPVNVIAKAARCNHRSDEESQETEEDDNSALSIVNGRRAMVAAGMVRNPYTGVLHPVVRPVIHPVRPVYRVVPVRGRFYG